MALKKKIVNLLHELSLLMLQVELSLNEKFNDVLATELRELKICRKVSMKVKVLNLMDEDDKDLRAKLREDTDNVVEKAEEVMFLVEDHLNLPTDPETQEDYKRIND